MSDSVAVSSGRRDGFWSRVWRPGARELVVFAALTVVGFFLMLVEAPGMAARLFGSSFPSGFLWGSDSWLVGSLVAIGLRSLVMFAAGYFFPKGFYLWGIAIAAHTPLTHLLTFRFAAREGVEIVSNEPAAITSFVLVEVMFVTFVILIYTAFSGLGTMTRYLASRRRTQ